jgi:Predicted acyl esterases
MTGISWGGFNALQVAALKPPALKAIITLCSTDDRYADDIHYMGGCLINENPSWSADRFTWGALPPDPQLVGDKWREIWLARLEVQRPWLEQWLAHQRRDAYWKHGSVSRITAPSLRGLCHRRLGGQLFQCRAAAAGGLDCRARG